MGLGMISLLLFSVLRGIQSFGDFGISFVLGSQGTLADGRYHFSSPLVLFL
jgi:hypothetical protein